ncbi:hypothetical protein NRB20_65870 [Nocardia sp. RB20]|uniref:Uncharacterized protein n=1 Tax=Nocardia macrotermitis TaxID=2585198 RepID=A0A7K0DCK3_9NOCA|nr:hypothetical protein [Nocardia macrotermitis]
MPGSSRSVSGSRNSPVAASTGSLQLVVWSSVRLFSEVGLVASSLTPSSLVARSWALLLLVSWLLVWVSLSCEEVEVSVSWDEV